MELRRGDHFEERLRLDCERFAEVNKADELRTLETVVAEVKERPDVRQAFRDAFALLKQKKTARPSEESNRIQPNQTR